MPRADRWILLARAFDRGAGRSNMSLFNGMDDHRGTSTVDLKHHFVQLVLIRMHCAGNSVEYEFDAIGKGATLNWVTLELLKGIPAKAHANPLGKQFLPLPCLNLSQTAVIISLSGIVDCGNPLGT